MDDVEDLVQHSPAVPRVRNPRVAAFAVGVTYGALAVAGALLGLIESFTFSLSLGAFPLAAAAYCALNFALFRAAGWGMGGKLGAAVPGVAWLGVLIAFSMRQPTGTLIVTGTTPGYLYLFGGLAAALFGVVATPSPGHWLLGGTGIRD